MKTLFYAHRDFINYRGFTPALSVLFPQQYYLVIAAEFIRVHITQVNLGLNGH